MKKIKKEPIQNSFMRYCISKGNGEELNGKDTANEEPLPKTLP
jgi:hypothetical protein